MRMIWINGKFVELDRAKISVFDRGFMYGDGVFETMREYAGKVFKLDRHFDRLFRSLDIINIKHKYSKEYLGDAIYRTLKINKLSSAYIKLVITRGEGRFGLSHEDEFSPNTVIIAKDFEDYPASIHEIGLSVNVAGTQNERSITSGIKTLNYLPYILARFDAKRKGYDDALLTNTKGFITEGATSNIFIVKNEGLITPSQASGILPGITRGVVIEIAKKLKVRVKEKLLTRRELLAADEAFFTNTMAEVLPVTKVDSKPIGAGFIGDITKLLHISYQKEVIREVA